MAAELGVATHVSRDHGGQEPRANRRHLSLPGPTIQLLHYVFVPKQYGPLTLLCVRRIKRQHNGSFKETA
jgi:hypothetical protein